MSVAITWTINPVQQWLGACRCKVMRIRALRTLRCLHPRPRVHGWKVVSSKSSTRSCGWRTVSTARVNAPSMYHWHFDAFRVKRVSPSSDPAHRSGLWLHPWVLGRAAVGWGSGASTPPSSPALSPGGPARPWGLARDEGTGSLVGSCQDARWVLERCLALWWWVWGFAALVLLHPLAGIPQIILSQPCKERRVLSSILVDALQTLVTVSE